MKIKPSIDKYNLKWINFPLEKDDWEKFEKNNPTNAKNEKKKLKQLKKC